MRNKNIYSVTQYTRLGPVAQKVLLLLLAGVSLSLSASPRRQFWVLKEARKDWERINRVALRRTIRRLYESKLIHMERNKDGSVTILLSDKGKEKALTYEIENLRIKPMKNWDHKWRIVLFDIPEGRKKARDALARVLKQAGFYKLQRSVFICPFECKNEVDFVVEFFNIRPFVRYVVADSLDNEFHLKKMFHIL